MARMPSPELPHNLPRRQVPHLHGPVVARANETCRVGRRVECERADEEIVTRESAEALACRGAPELDFAIVGARNNEVVLSECVR
jgi:hypothetical protein